MSTISIQGNKFLRFPHARIKSYREFRKCNAIWTMSMDSKSSQTNRLEERSVQPPTRSISQVPSLRPPDLRFDRLQPSDQDLILERKFEFGQFVAREAILDEEYWTAAWLRAESHWEDQSSERYINSQKRKFAEQEFNAIKKRTKGQNGQKCTCIVTVKKEAKNVKRTVLKSVVGTLDLNIRYLLHGETFPGERVKAPLFCSINRRSLNRYGYIANLCVAKPARRQGIASNMMDFAIEAAISDGKVKYTKSLSFHVRVWHYWVIERPDISLLKCFHVSGVGQVYVHVCRDNGPAQDLYQKMGFEMVDKATSQLLEERTYLLCFKI